MQRIVVIFRTIILAVVLPLFGTWAYAADCNSGGRYENMGDGTVQDCRTGLIWLKNASCRDTSGGIANPQGYLSWNVTQKWVEGLHDGLCGLTDGSVDGDWRLPTKTEWMAMVGSARKQGFSSPTLTNGAGTGKWLPGDVFDNVQWGYLWSSTTYEADTDQSWLVNMFNGSMVTGAKASIGYIWPVRRGQSATFGNVIIQ